MLSKKYILSKHNLKQNLLLHTLVLSNSLNIKFSNNNLNDISNSTLLTGDIPLNTIIHTHLSNLSHHSTNNTIINNTLQSMQQMANLNLFTIADIQISSINKIKSWQ